MLTLLMPTLLAAQYNNNDERISNLTDPKNETFYVVDGVLFEQADRLKFDPDQIASIEILKDTNAGLISCWVTRRIVLITLKKDARHVLQVFSKEDSSAVHDALVMIKKKGSDEVGVIRFSDENGNVNLAGLEKYMEYDIKISGFTFQSQELSIRIEPGQKTKVQLAKKALELQEVVVAANVTRRYCRFMYCVLMTVGCSMHPSRDSINLQIVTANLFPNPVAPGRELNIAFNIEDNQPVKMEVHNLAGQILFQQKADLKKGAQRFRVPVQLSWAKGVYIFSIKTEKELLLRERFLVQ